MLTRRCSEQRFFLRPDDETNNAFICCLALNWQWLWQQPPFVLHSKTSPN
jgi:hypothetical protein